MPALTLAPPPWRASNDPGMPGVQAHDFDFQQVVEQAEVGICITQDGLMQYVNPKFAELHGWPAAALVGLDPMAVVHPDYRAAATEIRRLRDLGQHHAAYESCHLRRDGSAFDCRVFGRTISYRGRQASLTTFSDISELAQAHRLAAQRAQLLERNELLCRSGSVEITPAQGRLLLSAGARTLLQTGLDGPDGDHGPLPLRRALRALPRAERAGVLRQWRQAVPGQAFQFRHGLRRADGSLLQVLHRGLIEGGTGSADARQPRLIATLQDITEQAAAQARIEQLVNYHPVTGLATRALLLKRATLAIELATGETRAFALLALRVADVGRVQEVLGLSAGDTLANTVAARLRACCRADDTAAHLGGGDFAVLLDPGAGGDASQALQLATRLQQVLAEPVTVEGTEFASGVQVGIAMFPGDSASAAELLAHARAACGRGAAGIQFFTREAAQAAARRIGLERALRRAFERQELQLHYQPQVDLRDGRIVGAEALLRWTSEEHGEISPAEFVPIAEETGLIVALGEWVFRSACRQSVQWRQAGLPPLRIGVNLSPRQLECADIAQRLQALMLETGADPGGLGVEVTESMLMRDLAQARRTLSELSAIGVEIALDDFGTGYSNLGVLRALPFDVLKIDRSLVHDVAADTADVSITRAVLALAKGLKLKVLAEGVETEGQLDLLVANGCELMQGFVFSRPLPAAGLEQLLREGARLPERFQHRQGRQRTLLLVDDEESVLSSLRRLLRRAGYKIVVARNGEEGLARLGEHDVDVILSDQRMPGMTGVEFLRRAKELYPDTMRLVLSGYTELQSITDAINEGAIYKFLTKPWDDERLAGHVAEAFQRKEMADDNRRLAAQLRQANEELALANGQQQQQLAKQREQLGLEEMRALNAQDLLEQLPTAMIGIDSDGTIVFANHQARALACSPPLSVGADAAETLPADWQAAWRHPDGQHRRCRVNGGEGLLSCAPLWDGPTLRGHLLSVIPVQDPR